MKSSISKAISSMLGPPDGWVRVESVRRASDGIVVLFGVYARKRGARLQEWEVRCRGVREARICDFNGGGIRLYSFSHPAARQYADPVISLRCRVGDRLNAALGDLLRAHVSVTDDWIPFDRYAPELKDPVAVRGPAFIVRGYAAALRRLGLKPKITAGTTRKRQGGRCRVLHFGESFVVAEEFEAVQSSGGLSNNEMLTGGEGGSR